MYPVTARFLEAVRNPPTITTRVEVWRAGARVDTYGPDGLPVYGGSVQIDRTKLVRRTLTGVQVDATDETWALLSPPGTELRCWRGFRYSNGQTEDVPVGRFLLSSLTENYGGDWDGAVDTAPDLMYRVQRARFLTPRTFPAGTLIRDVIGTLITEVLGAVTNTATSTATLTSPVVFERDRAKATTDSAGSIGVDVFCDPDGGARIVDLPQIGAPVWSVDAGDTGVLYTASRQRSTEESFSAVVAAPGQVDGAPPFAPQIVYDTNPQSPTYYLGPFGTVPYFLPAAELLGTAAQALAAANARLPLVSGPRAQVDCEAECNPALTANDTIAVDLPRRSRDQQPVTERQMIATLTVPLLPSGTQSISTFSTVADIPESE